MHALSNQLSKTDSAWCDSKISKSEINRAIDGLNKNRSDGIIDRRSNHCLLQKER